mmetsp:Transcript_15792/g.45594  ORF Transcript_15792/g.45594 Transcript_15792/m.45594 type:complete len:210 (+) Transcript_15792:1554-2183(+)
MISFTCRATFVLGLPHRRVKDTCSSTSGRRSGQCSLPRILIERVRPTASAPMPGRRGTKCARLSRRGSRASLGCSSACRRPPWRARLEESRSSRPPRKLHGIRCCSGRMASRSPSLCCQRPSSSPTPCHPEGHPLWPESADRRSLPIAPAPDGGEMRAALAGVVTRLDALEAMCTAGIPSRMAAGVGATLWRLSSFFQSRPSCRDCFAF